MGATIGVLALQGGFAEHLEALADLGSVGGRLVRRPADLDGLDGIILPGGESTAMGKLLVDFGLLEPLRAAISAGLPVWGTCAGAILLARDLANDERRHLALMDLGLERNAYGTQLDSFLALEPIPVLGPVPLPLVFIRAPAFVRLGAGVQTLASSGGSVVACRERNMVVSAFHPELSADRRFHRWFVESVVGARALLKAARCAFPAAHVSASPSPSPGAAFLCSIADGIPARLYSCRVCRPAGA